MRKFDESLSTLSSPFLVDEPPVFERQVPGPQVQIHFMGQVIVGDQLLGSITPALTQVWLTTTDTDPNNAGVHANAVAIVGAVGTPAVRRLDLNGADPIFSFTTSVPATGAGANQFTGFLVVRSTWDHSSKPAGQPCAPNAVTRTVRLPVSVAFPFGPFRVIIMHPTAGARYLWVQPEIRRRVFNSTAAAAQCSISVEMRNQTSICATHYRATFFTNANGVPQTITAVGRGVVFGVPTDEAIVVRASQDAAGAFAPRLTNELATRFFPANMFKFVTGTILIPRADVATFRVAQRAAAAVQMRVEMSPATLGMFNNRHVVLDPGHGVNYEHRQVRVYEWFLAHRIVSLVANWIRNLGGTVTIVPTARFRTENVEVGVDLVGFAPPDPRAGVAEVTLRIDRTVAPHTFRATVARNSLTLPQLAAWLGYNEAPARNPFFNPDYKTRAQFFADYPAFFQTLEARARPPAAGFVLVPGSSHWHAAGSIYRCTFQQGTNQRHVELQIQRGDALDLLPAEVRFLAKASVWRSWRNEMGALYEDNLGVQNNGRMEPGQALLDYAMDVLIHRDGRSPRPGQRTTFMRAIAADAFVTVHHNATERDLQNAWGFAALLTRGINATHPMSRTGKRFLKYVDPLGNGKHGSGLKYNDADMVSNPVTPDTTAYLEVEFMNAAEAGTPSGARYDRLNTPAFIMTTAEQVFAAITEMVLAAQPNAELDASNLGTPE